MHKHKAFCVHSPSYLFNSYLGVQSQISGNPTLKSPETSLPFTAHSALNRKRGTNTKIKSRNTHWNKLTIFYLVRSFQLWKLLNTLSLSSEYLSLNTFIAVHSRCTGEMHQKSSVFHTIQCQRTINLICFKESEVNCVNLHINRLEISSPT